MRYLAVLCAASILAAAEEIPPEVRLAQIRDHMLDQLRRQPNYTCVETIARSERHDARQKFQPLDALRLEVALVEGKEMFGWPGAEKFQATNLADFVRQGVIGNGDFALHARAIFGTPNASFEYKGEQGGLLRYDFQIPEFLSVYKISAAGHHVAVGYHGSILADPKTLDVYQIEVVADRIPQELGLAAATNWMLYARISIGGSDFLLPSESELTMADRDGVEHRNHTRFDSCREFTGESIVTFDEETELTAPPPLPAEDLSIPSDVALRLTLVDEVDTARAAVGDPVRARLENDIKEKGRVLFARGAMVLGRITRLERHSDFTTLGLSFSEIDTRTSHGHFSAGLEHVPQGWFFAPVASRRTKPDPGEGILTLRSGRVRLGRGILMFWRTRKS